jgi:hypothetical protein
MGPINQQRVVAIYRSLHRRVAALRVPILILAMLAFAAGCVISFRQLNISPAQLHAIPLMLLALVFVPLSIAYSAVNLMLMGKAADAHIGFGQGLRASVYAQVAELLPIPGGAIVRTTTLMKAGVSGLRSTSLVLAFSLLWIACAACGAGIALADQGWVAIGLGIGGGVCALAIAAWLAWRFGYWIALTATCLRVAGIALIALRLATSFAAVGVAMPWLASLTFAFATVAGSAASIVPAGLGVSEALSALLASPSGVTAAAAFLAAALSRLVGFAINMTLALTFASFGKKAPEPTHG